MATSSTPFIHPEHGPLHLGRPQVSPRNYKTMARAFMMHDYMATLPAAPSVLDNTRGIKQWGMMRNDTIGDCTCAAAGHLIMDWTAEAGAEVIVPDPAIVTAYSDITGYDPRTGAHDDGASMTDVLDYWRDTGIGGHKISEYAEVNITQYRVQQTVWVFDGAYVGLELPASAQSQVGGVWQIENFKVDGDAEKGSWGGHAVPVVKYDQDYLWVVTWGMLQQVDWHWFEWYADEVYAIISLDDKEFPIPVHDLVSSLKQVGT